MVYLLFGLRFCIVISMHPLCPVLSDADVSWGTGLPFLSLLTRLRLPALMHQGSPPARDPPWLRPILDLTA